MANQNDPWFLHHYGSCDIRLVTACGPWENSGPTYQFSAVLASRGIAHHLDDWGPKGDTNGLIGITRCGNTSARTSNKTVQLARVGSQPYDRTKSLPD
jgi:hypothetical protein